MRHQVFAHSLDRRSRHRFLKLFGSASILYPKPMVVKYIGCPNKTRGSNDLTYRSASRGGTGSDGRVGGRHLPRCGSKNVLFQEKYNRWQCSSKHDLRQFTSKTGTIFEDSPLGLDKCCSQCAGCDCKNGVSSYEVSRATGVTQKTACSWTIGFASPSEWRRLTSSQVTWKRMRLSSWQSPQHARRETRRPGSLDAAARTKLRGRNP